MYINYLIQKGLFGNTPATSEPETKVMPVSTIDRYRSWGKLGETAKGQGWVPVSWNDDTTTYKSNYNNGINAIVIPGEKQKGHIAVIGGNNNNAFDIVIRDAKDNVRQVINKNLTPQQVQEYFTNKKSTVGQRNEQVVAGINPDKAMANGSYTPLY